jgi:glutamine amidotransferase
MCRLFGLAAGTKPVTATFWLLDAPDSLTVQSHREPDGTGLGYFAPDGSPIVEKQPVAAYQDRAFAREARIAHSPTFVSHIRFASTGANELRNTHPFEQRGRLFAHNGVIEDLPALDDRLGSARELVAGDTDSERFFALITDEVARHDGDVMAGITAAVTWVAEHLPVLSLNFVLIAPGELWALRYPETHSLFALERAAGAPLEQRSSQGTRVHLPHGKTRRTVVVASEQMDDDPGWRMLQSGDLLHVDAHLTVRVTTVLDRPPAHPLTLEDLEGRARTSQTGT